MTREILGVQLVGRRVGVLVRRNPNGGAPQPGSDLQQEARGTQSSAADEEAEGEEESAAGARGACVQLLAALTARQAQRPNAASAPAMPARLAHTRRV